MSDTHEHLDDYDLIDEAAPEELLQASQELDGYDMGVANATEDYRALEEIGTRVAEGVASNEDYTKVREIARRHFPGQVMRISPRLVSRESALESVEGLRRYANMGIAAAIIMALVALIDHLFGNGKEDSKGGGLDAAAKKAAKQLEEATECYNTAIDKLNQAQSVGIVGNVVATVSEKEIEELLVHRAEKVDARKLSGYSKVASIIRKNAKSELSDKAVDDAVFLVLQIAVKYSKLIGGDIDYKLLKSHFDQGLDLTKTIDTDIFINGRNKWASTAFLSEPGFTPSVQLKKVYEVMDKYYKNMGEYRKAIAELVTAAREGKDFDYAGFSAKYRTALDDYASNSPIFEQVDTVFPFSKAEIELIKTDLKAHFGQLEANKVVPKNVLSKLVGHDQRAIIDELENFDKVIDIASDLETWIKPNAGDGLVDLAQELQQLSAKRQELKKDDSLNAVLIAGHFLQAMIEVIGSLITIPANFVSRTSRISVDFANFSKNYVEISNLAEKLSATLERGAGNENWFGPNAADEFSKLVNRTDDTQPEQGLAMREIKIPKDVILPAGIDIDSLKDLVELDPKEWTQTELAQFVSMASQSLDDLHRDREVIAQRVAELRRKGTICRDTVVEIERVHPGLLTGTTPIGRFTSFESASHSHVALENMAKLAAGAKLAGAIAGVAIIAKIIQWCYQRFQASRDVTRSIKGNVEVITKLNDKVIANITGSKQLIEVLKPDTKGQFNTEARKYFSDQNLGNSWYNIDEVDKSLMRMRTEIFAIEHAKTYSELVEEILKGGDVFRLIKNLTGAAEDGLNVLGKAVDNVSLQISHLEDGQSSNTSFDFKGLDYGLKNIRVSGLEIKSDATNSGIAEAITNFITTKKDAYLGKDKLRNVEVDKLNARLSETAKRIEEINGRVDGEFKKLQDRLDKLEKSNATASERDDPESDAKSKRDAVKSYVESIRAEFEAFSKIIGALKAMLTVLDAEIKKYGSTLKTWDKHVKWHNDKARAYGKKDQGKGAES